MNQCPNVLEIMAKQTAQGMTASMIILALIPQARPNMMAPVMTNTKTGAWYRSRACRRYANEEIAQPSTIQAPRSMPGDGSNMKAK